MSQQNSSGGIGVLGLLGVLFVGLKLMGFIDWSWWYVTLPFWGGFAFILGLTLLAVVVCGTIGALIAVVEYFELLYQKIRGRK